jgi:hypothetical protein
VFRIEVIGEGKCKIRIQPAVIYMAALMALSNVDHGPPPGFMNSIILVITTIVKRLFSPASAP